MMKKFMILCMSFLMTVTLAACGKKDDVKEYASTNEVLETVINGEELDFPFMGGGTLNMKDNAPETVDLKDEFFISSFGIKEDMVDKVKEMSSMTHGMNQNIFNGAAVKLNDGEDVSSYLETLKENFLGSQWMCGAPEVFYVLDLGNNYFVTFYGAEEVAAPLKDKALAQLTGSKLVIDEKITE